MCFATCIEGLFFFAAFAYVYFLRSKGLLHGLAAGTNWVFRDESAHMAFALDVIKEVRNEEPDLFDDQLHSQIRPDDRRSRDVRNAVCRGHSERRHLRPVGRDMRQYLEFIADQRLVMLGMQKVYGAKNPFSFMDLQDVQELR